MDKCIDNPALARLERPPVAAGVLQLRPVALGHAGRAALAAEAASELLTLPNTPLSPLWAARAYALAAASLDKSQAETRTKYAKAAIAALQLALANATARAPMLPYEPDRAALGDDPEFVAYLPSLTRRPKVREEGVRKKGSGAVSAFRLLTPF